MGRYQESADARLPRRRARTAAHRGDRGDGSEVSFNNFRHSGAMRSIEPGISRFPDAQLRIWGLVLTHHPGMTDIRRSLLDMTEREDRAQMFPEPELEKKKTKAVSLGKPAAGQCLCGKVAFEIDVPARWAWHDHSLSSRRAHGAAYATYVGSWRK